MKVRWSYFVFTIVASTFGLFGSPMRAEAADTLVGISTATGGAGQVEATGTSTLGTGRKLVKVQIVLTDANGNKTRYDTTVAMNGDWSGIAKNVPAGTYDVSAEIVTTDNCGGNQQTTASDPNQTKKGIKVTKAVGC